MTPPFTGWIIAAASSTASAVQIAACHPSGIAGGDLDRDHQRHQHVAESQDDDVGGKVVRLMDVEPKPAMGAGGRGLQEAREHPPLAAGGATAAQPSRHGGGDGPVRWGGTFCHPDPR